MDVSVSVIISAVGVAVSAGVAYGLVKQSISGLAESLKLVRTDIEGVRGEVKTVSLELTKVKDKVLECDKQVALVALELHLTGAKGL